MRSHGQQGLSAAPTRARAPFNQPAEVTTTEDEMDKPKPEQYYDIHEVTEYMNKKYGFTDDDWDEVIDNFADLLSNGAILTIDAENGNKLEEAIVKEFGENGTESVDIRYWW